ncbi:MAG: hypothetical protein U9R57_16290 [Thermodesulfobacteriota bacterium]|nr:hypothetical protein [Thermodesulfobacteriota bacterium]
MTIVNIDPLNPPDPPDPENKCEALSGELEVQILVGPAGVVGLEPMAVGSIPFYTICDGDSCTVQGNGDFSYQEVLSEDWGTYNVTLDMDVEIIGECVSSATNDSLNLTVTASGNQMVEVDADDFHGEYPWEGTHEFDVVFPLEEGAKAGGEGWEVVLHIN